MVQSEWHNLKKGSVLTSGLVAVGLVAAGGVVDLHMRLQVVAVHVEAQCLAVVLDRTPRQTSSSSLYMGVTR